MGLNGTLGFLGYGNMGLAILEGLLDKDMIAPDRAYIYDPAPDRRSLAEGRSVQIAAAPADLAGVSDTLVLAVKPQMMGEALESIAGAVRPETLVISIAAGISIAYIQQRLGGGTRVARVMPNTPALVLQGAAGFALSENCEQSDGETVQSIFEAVGVAVQVAESDIDAVTALSGSGPAYFFYMVECLVKAAVKEGLEEATATELATQTLLGAGRLLKDSIDSAAILRQKVTSKGGTTEAALNQFRADGLETVIQAGVSAAAARSRELGA